MTYTIIFEELREENGVVQKHAIVSDGSAYYNIVCKPDEDPIEILMSVM